MRFICTCQTYFEHLQCVVTRFPYLTTVMTLAFLLSILVYKKNKG